MSHPPKNILLQKSNRFLFSHKADSESAATCLLQLQHITFLDCTVSDDVGRRIFLVVGVWRILIDGAVILASLVEEVEAYY